MAPPRAYWKGYLKLSLSCPIALYPATSEREKISFHEINKNTGNRIHYKKVDAKTGDEVDRADIVKGYEFAKGKYIEIDSEELDAVAIPTKHTIEIEQFVPKQQIDELYIRDPYYIVPDGEVGREAFAVIRDAIRDEGVVALGQVVFTSREHVIALEARGKGLMGITLRYPYEVRDEDTYFAGIKAVHVPKDMLDLHIVGTKRGKFVPGKFEDRYEGALKRLIQKKRKGEAIERPREPVASNVIDLMEALRRSAKSRGGSNGRLQPKKTRRTRAHPKKAS